MRLGSWVSLNASPVGFAASLPAVCIFALLVQGCETAPGTDTTEIGDGDGTGNGDGDGDAEWEPIPARGDISLTSVVVNQGVDVLIADEGEWVGAKERNTVIVANRDTLIRGFWTVPDDWVPRDIRAQLELLYPDGSTVILEDVPFVDGPSFPGDLERSFIFQLLADQFPPGVKYHMTLWENGPGFEDQRESTTIIESPLGGLKQIGVQSEPAELKVVLVPVQYKTADCDTNTAEITEEQEQLFLDYIHEQNPVTEVIWEFRRESPIEWNTELTSLAELWEPLQTMRIEDGAAPNAYYYALVSACASGIDGAGGIAPGLAPPTKAAAYQRVSSGLWLDGDKYSYHTMVHELGHNQGRAHVFCAGGDAAGTDPTYPYDNGIIGIWGFGIRLFRLHNPTSTYDYMTYCAPSWVSDWTWSKTYEQITTLTAWDYEDAAPDPASNGEVLIGLLMKNGSEIWWTTQGSREPEYFSGAQTVAFNYNGEIINQPAAIEILDDGNTMITAPVPRPQVELTAATRYQAGQAHVIDLQAP